MDKDWNDSDQFPDRELAYNHSYWQSVANDALLYLLTLSVIALLALWIIG